MLIHVLESAAKVALEKGGESAFAIGQILDSYKRGRHLVLLEPTGVCRSLSRSGALSEYSRAAASEVLANYSQLAGVRGALASYVEVGAGDQFVEGPDQRSQQVVLRVDLNKFENQALELVTLIGENANDARFYLHLAAAYGYFRRWNIPAKAKCRGGGGTTLGAEFEHAVSNGEVCFCIADSDRACPENNPGSTARALMSAQDRVGHGLHACCVLSCRELENLLPLGLLQQVANEAASSQELRKYVLLRRLVPGNWHVFLDLKAGLKGFDVRAAKAKTPTRNHLEWVVGRFRAAAQLEGCKNSNMCASRNDCECSVVPPLGDRVLSLVLECVERWGDRTLMTHLELESEPEVTSLASLLFAWTCCRGPSRA